MQLLLFKKLKIFDRMFNRPLYYMFYLIKSAQNVVKTVFITVMQKNALHT